MRLTPLVVLAACGGDDAMMNPDGSTTVDAPPGCTQPALDAPWLASSLTGWVEGLAAAPRSTVMQRDAARVYLANQLTVIGWTPQTHQYANGANVYATIPATMGSEKQLVVGAHFDTVANSPGANDNASGAAVVLAIARYLRDTPCRKAPVIIVFFDQEELGLFGARAFAQTLDPTQTRAVHTIDQVAWDSDNDKRYELELPTPTLEAEWRAAAAVVGVTLTATTTSGTDHEAFRDRGFAAIGLTEEYVGGDTSPFRHQSGDTPATVKASYLIDAAKLTARVVLGETAL
ncbi:MAG: M28 family metallopeptidase [Myxococcota bacterium]|nr:M28 family metallopeptidase [Myxococcota bacterium]